MGVEGVVAKRLDGPYEPGRRSSGWIKVKNVHTQDVVDRRLDARRGRPQGEPRRARGGGDGRTASCSYAGKVGTGFTESTLTTLQRELEPLRRDGSPFVGRQPPKGTVFVEPRLVAEVEFREWTRTGTLRAPSFKGLRYDKDPQDCIREEG